MASSRVRNGNTCNQRWECDRSMSAPFCGPNCTLMYPSRTPASKAVGRALDLGVAAPVAHESLAGVLRRPSSRSELAEWRLGLNVVLTIASVCQFVTAAAHADDYPAYPRLLVRTMSHDLRRALVDLEHVISELA